MVMADRRGVRTAPLPITVIDAVLLVGQILAALLRVPFRRPLSGPNGRWQNLGAAVTREVVRAFMGYVSSLPVDEFRSMERLLDRICALVMPPVVHAFEVDCRRVTLGGVPGLLYEPRDRPAEGVILYLHGGGYIGTSPRMYGFFTARLAHVSACAVFVADYRLAPEFPFPAGVEDAARVLAALVDHGAPPERLLVAGDSGGGGLANALVLAVPEHERLHRPAGLLLFSPEVDLRLDAPSVNDNAATDILPWNIPTAAYLHGVDPASPYVSATGADLSGFPPTYVAWGADEMFRDPIRDFADRLEGVGVPVDGAEATGMFHVFPILMPWADASQDVYEGVGAFIARLLAEAPPLPEAALRSAGRRRRRR